MKEEEMVVFVLFRKGIATYAVTPLEKELVYEGRLLKYTGKSDDLPPPKVVFRKEGRHCTGNTDQQDLLDDLYDAVQLQLVRG